MSNKQALIKAYETLAALLDPLSPEDRTAFVNALVVCWDLSDEGLGYVVGRLVEKYT
ncbi:MAG: hypothetical protein ACI4QC_03415 [Thermoguttaceae bacterium]